MKARRGDAAGHVIARGVGHVTGRGAGAAGHVTGSVIDPGTGVSVKRKWRGLLVSTQCLGTSKL